jgi:hypothetical protein
MNPLGFSMKTEASNGTGGSQARDRRHVLGSGTKAPFVTGPDYDRLDRGAPSHVERSDALWRIELMSGNSE